jgi:hypothetical protein
MEEEEENLDANLDNLDLSPYELSLYMEEQRKKRREELAELLEVQEIEETLKDGDYSIQVNISAYIYIYVHEFKFINICIW